MTKPRKKYQGPKYIAKNPIITFLGSMSETHASSLRATKISNHIALSNMARGAGDYHDWFRLNSAINMALVMSEQGIGPEYIEDFKAASAALLACVRRAGSYEGRYLFKGDELRAMNEGMEAHDLQITCVRFIDIDRAEKEVVRRLKNQINVAKIEEVMA